MNKVWSIAVAFADGSESNIAVATRIAPSAEIAVAMVVSDAARNTPLPLIGVASIEITREQIELALKALEDSPDPKPATILSLVPGQCPAGYGIGQARPDEPESEPA
jgi:hypothetical protein